jgi:electron transfer flavoprotein alpha subunit
MSGILAYALHYEGAFNKNSLGGVSEAARLASELGCEAHAVVIGDVSDDLAASLGNYGVTKVFRAKDAPEGLAQPVVDVMAQIMDEGGHDYALFGGGLLGFEIGAGLTARLDAGVCMEVTNVRVEDGKLVAERPILQDSQISSVHYRSGVGVIIGRLNAFELKIGTPATPATVQDLSVDFKADNDFPITGCPFYPVLRFRHALFRNH